MAAASVVLRNLSGGAWGRAAANAYACAVEGWAQSVEPSSLATAAVRAAFPLTPSLT
jgi:hypothetical protein